MNNQSEEEGSQEGEHLFVIESDDLDLCGEAGERGGATTNKIIHRSSGTSLSAYHTVSNIEDGREDVCISDDEIECTVGNERWQKLWFQPLLPDDRFAIARVKLLDGPCAVKLLKFVLVTFLGIVSMFGLVRWVVRALLCCLLPTMGRVI